MKFIFLDRDGVINEDRSDYVKSWSEFSFIPGSLDALKLLTEQHYKIIIITNQSVINRKLVTKETLERIFHHMKKAISDHGGRIERIFYCPHTPEDRCLCRKPKPGLVHQAREAYSIDLSSTCMIGDSRKDIQCGLSAGCGQTILVRTGYGTTAEKQCLQAGIQPDYIAQNLLDAVQWLLP